MKKSGPSSSSSLGSHIIDTKFVLSRALYHRKTTKRPSHHHHAARRHHQRHKAKHKKAAAAAHDDATTTTEIIEEAATQNRCGRESIAFARDFGREKKGR